MNGNDDLLKQLIPITKQATKFQEEIFEYRHNRAVDSFESYWPISFYRSIYYIVTVDPKTPSKASVAYVPGPG